MIQEMDEKTKEMLRGAGREMAVDMMESACTTAKDKKQMHNQIYVIGAMAKHALATIAYNAIRQGGLDEEFIMGMLSKELLTELKWIKDQPDEELVFSGPGPGDSNETVLINPE